jgi:peroxiredoxin
MVVLRIVWKNHFRLVMVSRGSLEENAAKAREHRFPFPVVIQPGWRVSKEYGIFATPVAFLIDESGRIARNVARGVAEILDMGESEVEDLAYDNSGTRR